MFRSPFPKNYVFVEFDESQVVGRDLSAVEAGLIGDLATEKRKKEFRLGRIAGETALKGLGIADCVLKGELGEPIWPDGVVGSITHKDDLAIVAVARAEQCLGLGLDLERTDKEISPGFVARICTEKEQEELDLSSNQAVVSLFSAKETIYKVLYPLCKCHIGFKDVDLQFNEGKYLATLNRDLNEKFVCGFELEVCWQKVGKYLLTSLFLEK
jgi:4'-phosphopantetheinyl transferase EntD